MKTVFWIKKTNLSEDAMKALKELLPDHRIIQLNDVSVVNAEHLLRAANVLAFQKSSLPQSLERYIKSRGQVLVYEIDFDSLEFIGWSWL